MRRRLNILLWGAAAFSIAGCFARCGDNPGLVTPPVEKVFEIIPERTFIEFAFGESKEIGFEVTGEGAVDIEAPEITFTEGWRCSIVEFERNGDGYRGTVGITAPGRESSAQIRISATNGDGVERSAVMNLTAVSDPLEVSVDVPGGPLQLEVSEQISVPFMVACNKPAALTTEVSATNSWNVKLERFSGGGAAPSADYEGAVLVMAPWESSSSEVTINIRNEAGEVVASAEFDALCDKRSDLDIAIEFTGTNMNFAFVQTRTVEFEVRGEDAEELTASVEAPDGWTAEVTSFLEYSYGYYGVLTITSPSAESEGEVVLTVSGDGDGVSGSVGVWSCPGGLRFEREGYDFDLYDYQIINYTITGTNGPMMAGAEIVCPDGWQVDYGTDGVGQLLAWDEERDIYTGSFRLRSGAYPEDNVIFVRLTDDNREVTDWSVAVVSGGGDPVPVPKQGANCIVVDRVGRVSFDARRGDGTQVAGSEVKCIWADREGLIDEGSSAYSAGKIIFDTAASFTPGNMLLGLFDQSGRIVWTWHIWFVAGLNLNAAPGKFMNMPLGAFSAERTSFYGTEDVGLLYQWGRKEPFPGMRDKLDLPEEPSGAFRANTAPTVMAEGYSWGVTADRMDTHDGAARYSVFMASVIGNMPSSGREMWSRVSDPCPAGWRVPTRKELREYWALRSPNGSHTLYPQDGMTPDKYRNDWWSVTGYRAANSTNSGGMRGALIQNVRFCYWSCESIGRHCPPHPGDPLEEQGYIYASSIIDNGRAYMAEYDRLKSDAMAVRCIKE